MHLFLAILVFFTVLQAESRASDENKLKGTTRQNLTNVIQKTGRVRVAIKLRSQTITGKPTSATIDSVSRQRRRFLRKMKFVDAKGISALEVSPIFYVNVRQSELDSLLLDDEVEAITTIKIHNGSLSANMY